MPKHDAATEPTHEVRLILDLIANRWSPLVIHCLSRATRRFSNLHRGIGGVSKKVLTGTLRDLERSGLVHRKVFAEVPPKVEYSLTPLGMKVAEPIAEICKWAKGHPAEVKEIEAHRRRNGRDT
jgi:DNA-binding HxlR family transcriptional regulator